MIRNAINRASSVLIIFMLLVSAVFITAQPSYAATVKTIPSTSNIVSKANKLKLSKDNYSVTWNITNHKIKTGSGSEKILCMITDGKGNVLAQTR